jgi:hypothetical protein
MISSTQDSARRARRRTRAAISTVMAVGAMAALAGPANADLTVAANDVTGFPASVTDALNQTALLCLGPAPECGAGAPDINQISQPDGEAFYWSGAVSAPLADGAVDVSFDVEAATGPDGVQTTFQRIQVGSRKDTAKLPDGEYTITSPFGTFTATKDASRPGNWRRIETSSAGVGTIDHFLTSVGHPVGYYGDADGNPGPVVGGDAVGTVTVQAPGPAATAEIAATADWTISGRMDGTPLGTPPPPADGDGDGVPNNVDGCPSTPGTAANHGCPDPAAQPQSVPAAGTDRSTTIIQVVERAAPAGAGQVLGVKATSPLAVSGLTLARRISIARVRQQGLRASMQVKEGTNVVRIAIYKARDGRKTGSALFVTNRVARAGLLRMTLRNRSLLAKLRAGTYVLEARSGQSLGSLAAPRRITFTVTP